MDPPEGIECYLASTAFLDQNGLVCLVVGLSEGIWERHQAFSYIARGMHFVDEHGLRCSKVEPKFTYQPEVDVLP